MKTVGSSRTIIMTVIRQFVVIKATRAKCSHYGPLLESSNFKYILRGKDFFIIIKVL